MRDITKDIVNIVKAQTGQDATQNTRKKEVVEARMMVYKMLNEIYQMNITEIGREFGKNHATIYHAQL
jgi:chromosomal replication initiation ATPase DnaA